MRGVLSVSVLLAAAALIAGSCRAAGTGTVFATEPLRLNGAPFFPIGIVGAPLDLLGSNAKKPDFDRMYRALEEAGVNLFYPQFLTSEQSNTSAAAVFDFIPDTCLARRADPASGLAALARTHLAVLLPAFVAVEKKQDVLEDRELDETFAALRLTTVRRAYEGIPIFGYQNYDDAPVVAGRGVPLRKLRQIRSLVASQRQGGEPYVFLVHPTVEATESMEDAGVKSVLTGMINSRLASYSAPDMADSVGLYIYPVPFLPPSVVGRAIDRMLPLQPGRLRPLVALQGFGFADNGAVRTARRPSATETRFMAYQAIVHHAGGIVWWGANFISSESTLWGDLKRTAGELAGLSGWLVQPDAGLVLTAPQAEVLLKRPQPDGNVCLLIVVNPLPQPLSTSVSVGPAQRITAAKDHFGGAREITADGALPVTLDGYGVGVFEVVVPAL